MGYRLASVFRSTTVLYSTVCTVPNFSKNTQNFRGFANMLQNTGGARLKAVQGRAKTVSPGVWNLTEPIFTEVL